MNNKITFIEHNRSEIPLRLKWFSNPEVSAYLAGDEEYSTDLIEETAWFDRYEKDEAKKFFTIFCDNNPIGLVGLSKIKDDSAEVFIVIGETSLWGQGIGQKALEFIENKALKFKIKKLTIWVSRKNERAISLYKKTSYKEIPNETDEIKMEKVLI